jgi:hypothetical protein
MQVIRLFLLSGLIAWSGFAVAIIDLTDSIELEGFIKAQNVIRERSFSESELIMQRNTAQLEGKYYFLKDSSMFGRFNTGALEEATLTVIGRTVYDSVYDLRDSYDDLDNVSESKIREVFIDLVIPPFTFRAGRQQVVWGETDNFRALDILNPIDLSWHWSQESWEDIRIPLWMVKGIYDIGKFGPFEETFVESVWIPADFEPNQVNTDPRYPWAFYGAGLPEMANAVIINDQLYDLHVGVNDRSPGKSMSDGQAGIRFKGIWGNVDFSLNYFYGYSTSTGVRSKPELTEIDGDRLYSEIDLVNPRIHVVGITGNYSEERFTQSVIRLEATVTKGVPVAYKAGTPDHVDPDQDRFDTAKQMVVMFGMDRPTWIRWLNQSRTVFISTQLFWRRYLDYSSYYQGVSSVVPAEINGEVIEGKFVGENNNTPDRDEFVFTMAASTAYGPAGRWKPQFVFVYDPRSTGALNKLSLEYLWSKHFITKVSQSIYWRESGKEQGPWAIGDLWGTGDRRRNETVIELIFQF